MTRRCTKRQHVALSIFLIAASAAALANAQPPERGQQKEANTVEGVVKQFTMGPDEIINGVALEIMYPGPTLAPFLLPLFSRKPSPAR
jgi:hypothetical protein